MRSALQAVIGSVLAAAGLAGCTEYASSLGGASQAQASLPSPDQGRAGHVVRLSREQVNGSSADYRFRLIGSENGPTSVYLVIRHGEDESETFVARCSEIDTDEFLPEGLLAPVLCDGRRIVLHQQEGRFVVSGGPRTVSVAVPGYRVGEPAAPAPTPERNRGPFSL